MALGEHRVAVFDFVVPLCAFAKLEQGIENNLKLRKCH